MTLAGLEACGASVTLRRRGSAAVNLSYNVSPAFTARSTARSKCPSPRLPHAVGYVLPLQQGGDTSEQLVVEIVHWPRYSDRDEPKLVEHVTGADRTSRSWLST